MCAVYQLNLTISIHKSNTAYSNIFHLALRFTLILDLVASITIFDLLSSNWLPSHCSNYLISIVPILSLELNHCWLFNRCFFSITFLVSGDFNINYCLVAIRSGSPCLTGRLNLRRRLLFLHMWRHRFLPLLRITVSSQIVTVPYKSFAAALGGRGSLPNDTPLPIPCLKGDAFCSKLGQENTRKV